jgi:hypothetical protein
MTRTPRGTAAALAVLILCACATPAQAGLISFNATPYTGDPACAIVTFDDVTAPGTVRVTVAVDTRVCLADINGFFFNVGNESLIPGLSVAGDVTLCVMRPDDVRSAGPGNNVNGGRVGAFDVGLRVGSPGIGGDDIQSATFVLSHADAALTSDLFAGAANDEGSIFAVRLTSVGEPGSNRNGSSKLRDDGELPPPLTTEPPGPVHIPEPSTLAGLGTLCALGVLARWLGGTRGPRS